MGNSNVLFAGIPQRLWLSATKVVLFCQAAHSSIISFRLTISCAIAVACRPLLSSMMSRARIGIRCTCGSFCLCLLCRTSVIHTFVIIWSRTPERVRLSCFHHKNAVIETSTLKTEAGALSEHRRYLIRNFTKQIEEGTLSSEIIIEPYGYYGDRTIFGMRSFAFLW